MSSIANAAKHRRNASDRDHDQAVRTILAFAGAMISLVGLVLVIGGYLSAFNGSAFHIFAGVSLTVTGGLVARRHPAGAWTYMLVFAGTVGWSLGNVDSASMLAPRLIGPLLLLVMIAVLMPALCRWQPKQTIAVITVLMAGTIGLGVLSLPNHALAGQAAVVTQFLNAGTKGILQ